MIYFGLVYFAQGIGQAGALIGQPLMYYLKSLGMTTDQVAGLLAVLTVPWINQAGLRPTQRFHPPVRLSKKELSRPDERAGSRRLSLAYGLDRAEHDCRGAFPHG